MHLAKLLYEEKLEEVLKNTSHKTIEEALAYLSLFGISKKSVEIWGTGLPKRDFLWSEDMADACFFIMQNRDFKDMYSLDEFIEEMFKNNFILTMIVTAKPFIADLCFQPRKF